MTSTDTIAAEPAPHIGLRIALVLIAVVETSLALSDFPGAFDWHDAPPSVGQFLINARLAIHPAFAIAALALAAFGRVRTAILVLSAYILIERLSELPSFLRDGIEWRMSFIGLSLFAEQVVFPLLAILAIVLVLRNERLWWAVLFVALPPANLVLGAVVFPIAIMIYGF